MRVGVGATQMHGKVNRDGSIRSCPLEAASRYLSPMQFSPFTRRNIVSGMALMAATVPGRSQGREALPTLRSGRSQFVEFEPAMPVPDFRLTRLDGKRQSLHEFRGKVLIVNFWASWCPPCRTEIPLLEKLAGMGGDMPARAIAVAIDAEGARTASPFLASLNVKHLPVFLDPTFRMGRRADEARPDDPFRLFGLPMSYVLSRDMRNLGYFTGLVDWTSPAAGKLLQAAALR
ncbi:MAG: thiol--disulfide interchange redox-active center transmembrane [Beijerinckiaceae bacterium]|nr:MAG: thiol--disulfide interchange redox-active center transmembrane [Beijerinckiaceae bacterium]